MSSGIGVKGTIGRCYPFYADLRKCVAKKQLDSPQAMCWQENEDYFECVHGFKEKARILQVVTERQRREKLGESFEIKRKETEHRRGSAKTGTWNSRSRWLDNLFIDVFENPLVVDPLNVAVLVCYT